MLKTLEKRKTMSQSDSPFTYIYFVIFYMRSVEKLSLLVHRIINVINFFQIFKNLTYHMCIIHLCINQISYKENK
jgi:hypothetical protein